LKLREAISEKQFRRIAFGVPSSFIVFSIVTVLIYPAHEAELGINSSLRPVANRLKTKNVCAVLLDKYWPGMEFYIGENVFYVTKKGPRQWNDDSGICNAIGETHFMTGAELEPRIAKLTKPGVWLVHYLPDHNSPFGELEKKYGIAEHETVGNFELLRLNRL
jgi:hypothetical protein